MNELTIFNRDGQLLVDSREVAEMIEVRHSDLMEKIREYYKHLLNGNFRSVEFFIESTYQDSTGRELPCYLLTKKGCDMVANKMTGKKGVLFTATYVNAFEKMREQLTESKALPENSEKLLRAEAAVNNSRARLAGAWIKLASEVYLEESKQICAAYASSVLTGGSAVLPLPEAGEKHYSAAEVGELLGISAQKVGRLATQHNLKVEPYGKWYHDKSPYSPKEIDTFRYNKAAVDELKRILKYS